MTDTDILDVLVDEIYKVLHPPIGMPYSDAERIEEIKAAYNRAVRNRNALSG